MPRPSFVSISQGNFFPFSLYNSGLFYVSASVEALFVRSVPDASIGCQHLLSLKVVMSQTEQGPWSFAGSLGRHGSQWVNKYFVKAGRYIWISWPSCQQELFWRHLVLLHLNNGYLD